MNGRGERTERSVTSPRVVIALLTPVRWAPPGIDPGAWRAALVEDVVDLVATLGQVDAAIAATAADRELAESVAWPDMQVYEVTSATPTAAFELAAKDGYAEAAVLAGDVPDLPGLLVGKLLQPLSTRTLAAAPAHDGGLVGVATRLPAPGWLPEIDLDVTAVDDLQRASARRTAVTATPGWHRQRGPVDLSRLDPALAGWAATRAVLGG
jgi:hypothetical protein